MKAFRKFKLYRWWEGGVWILHKDEKGWVRGAWLSSEREIICDERHLPYLKSSVGVIEIEDYTW